MLNTGIDTLKTLIEEFKSAGSFTVVYLIAIIYLIAYKKEDVIHSAIAYFAILIMLAIFNPISAYIIGNKFFDQNVYFYLVWAMPVGIVISYMYTDLLFNSNSKIKITFGLILVSLFIFYVGGYYYASDIYSYKENNMQIISNSQKEIFDYLIENNNNETLKIYFEPKLNELARIYSDKFILAYYKSDKDSYEGDFDPLLKMQNTFEYEAAVEEIIAGNYSYLVWNDNSLDLTKSGLLENVYSNSEYQIYKIK